jgi:hypothetical protein
MDAALIDEFHLPRDYWEVKNIRAAEADPVENLNGPSP